MKRRKLSEKYNLAVVNPGLAKQWHPSKNGNLTPEDVLPNTHKKVWWICEKGHEWEASIKSRSRGHGCPCCAGQKVSNDNCLATKYPSVVKEWNKTKNVDLTPLDIMPNSHSKVWWVCEKGHEYQMEIATKTRGSGCPICSGRRVSKENCLETLNPQIAREWHPTKNGNLSPKNFTVGSGKKVWWVCAEGHEWKTSIHKRTEGKGCPYCAGQKVDKSNSLKTLRPDLAKEWHPQKNGKLTPSDVIPGSQRRVWWKCKKMHEWETRVVDRNRKNTKCPYCSQMLPSAEYNLAIINPDLASEWHPTKNGKLTPDTVTPGANKKVWWKCKKDHEWVARIADRNNGTGCPNCHIAISEAEIRLYSEIKHFFTNAKQKYLFKNMECDIFIPDVNLAIEYDGSYWHKDSFSRDKQKGNELKAYGIDVLRIREKGLKNISEIDIHFNPRKESLLEVIKKILEYILKHHKTTKVFKKRTIEYFEGDSFINQELFKRIINRLPYPLGGNSLAEKYPGLSSEWHPIKNGSLKPDQVNYGSHKKAWWQCKSNHEWAANIDNRVRGAGCPYCAGQKATSNKNLAVLNPGLCTEWNYNKNIGLEPVQFLPFSQKKVWWKCAKGHEWEETIAMRSSGYGCPFCSGHRPSEEYNLAKKNPELAREWNYEKNLNLKPEDFTPSSHKKVWWKCSNNHDWLATIKDRNYGSGCPICKREKRNK